MKQAGSSAVLQLPLLLMLSLLLAAAVADPVPGGRHLPVSSCQTCCSEADGGAHCPPWCPRCRGQCPTPALKSCPYVHDGTHRQPCQDDDCPSGQRCCFDGCRVTCQPVCPRPCPPGQRCSLDCPYPPCPHQSARCVPVQPTCAGYPCPSGSHCVPSGGRPRCEPLATEPGTCPINDLLPLIFCPENAEDECYSDSNCPGNQKCCSYGCARTCVQSCRPACRSDQNCVLKRLPELCLRDGCHPRPPITTCEPKNPCSVVDCQPGFRCVERDGKAECEPLPDKPGTCPVNDLLPFIICLAGATGDDCSGDSSCEGSQKCCSYGCARTCVPPCLPACRSDQNCILNRPPGPCLDGDCAAGASTCELKNPCAVVRCRSGFHCVVRDGSAKCEPLTTRPGTCPADIFSSCLEKGDKCTSDDSCEHGQKCCSRDCGKECSPVCQKPCPHGKTCRIVVFPCSHAPCPESAHCIDDDLGTRPGVCPRNDIITTCQVRHDSCSSDAECKPGDKCCSVGCGRTCVSACPRACPAGQTCKTFTPPCFVPPCPTEADCFIDEPVERQGICPRNIDDYKCKVRQDTCSSDAQCEKGQKCCAGGCGQTCVAACQRPCPYGQECNLVSVHCLVPPCPEVADCI